MALKFVKPAAIAAFGAILLGFFLFGREFFSYVRTSTKAVQAAVQENVSVEFELQRARDLVEDLLPKMQANVRMIAEDEVEIAILEKDIAKGHKRLISDREALAQKRKQLETQQVSYRSGSSDLSREQLTERLSQSMARYREAELVLSSKEELLDTRKQSLAAALQMHERAKHQKLMLEQKIEALVAQHRLVQASSPTSSGVEDVDTTRAQELLEDIQKRLDVSQRVLAHQNELTQPEPIAEVVDEQEVLAEYDRYFKDSQEADDQLVVAQ